MDYIGAYLAYLQHERRYSTHTLGAYQSDLNQYMLFLDGIDAVDSEISAEHIRAWIVSLSEAGIAPPSVNRKLSSVRSFYSWLHKVGYVKANPAALIPSLKTAKRLPDFVPEKELGNLLDTESVWGDGFSGLRNRAVIVLLYATGIRLSELTGLTLSGVNLDEARIKVLGKRNRERIIPLLPETVSILYRYRESLNEAFPQRDHPFFFVTDSGKPLYPVWVNRLSRSVLGSILALRKRSPHVFRHTFATHLLNHGADITAIKNLLGHASLGVTQIYTHNTIKTLKTVYKRAHPRA